MLDKFFKYTTRIYIGFLNRIKLLKQEDWFVIFSILVLIIGFFTFFFNYQNPNAPFWDENFHVSAAEKYISRTFFVELHPPLGKLLIAAGEAIWNPNSQVDKSVFLKGDYTKEFPTNFNFIGVRFFPSLFAFLAGYLVFLIFYLIFQKSYLAFLFSSLYLFNNPMIVHFRGAMLDGIQMFFVLLALLYFLYLFFSNETLRWRQYLILGILVGLALSVKINSAILVFLFPILFYDKINQKFSDRKSYLQLFKNFFVQGFSFSFGCVIIFLSVFYIHQVLAVRQLPEKEPYNGYQINSQYKSIIDKKDFYNPLNVFFSTYGWYQYQTNYNKGVPRLDVTKPDENGSYPTNWIVGRKAISYRWQRYPVPKSEHFTYSFNSPNKNQITLDQHARLPLEEKQKWVVAVQYLYLQVNPAISLIGILGLVLSSSLILAKLFFSLKIINHKYFSLISYFTLLYIIYMASVLSVGRVLYMYHYFIGLMLSLIMFSLVFYYKFEDLITKGKNSKQKLKLNFALALVWLIIVGLFIFYAPFTYYLPLTSEEFELRNWFDFWGLKVVS